MLTAVLWATGVCFALASLWISVYGKPPAATAALGWFVATFILVRLVQMLRKKMISRQNDRVVP